MTNSPDITERLKRSGWLMRAETQQLMALLDGARGRTRAVGGIVRDTLLNIPHTQTDIDFATELLPAEVIDRARQAGIAAYPTGFEHGTVTLRLPSLVAEVTTLREDIETDGRHALVRFGHDWKRDAARRDFTLNALYAGMDGELFDPLDGIDDCLNRRVRFIGEPAQRIAEDRLRVYRFYRFSASHGGEQFDRAGLAACMAAAGSLGNLAAERVGAEMRRMLALPKVALTLKTMVASNVLRLPAEVLNLLQTYERRVWRPSYLGRLALILSQVDADELQARWRLANEDRKVAEAILTVAQLLADYRLNEAAYRHPAALADGVEVATALANWGDAGRLAVREKLERMNVPPFPISGTDLINLGIRPGRRLGIELERLEIAWIESGFALDRTELLGMVRVADTPSG